MADLTPTTEWQSVTLSANEAWQVSEKSVGSVEVSSDSDVNTRTSFTLEPGSSIQFSSGKTIYYRKTHKHRASIQRIEV